MLSSPRVPLSGQGDGWEKVAALTLPQSNLRRNSEASRGGLLTGLVALAATVVHLWTRGSRIRFRHRKERTPFPLVSVQRLAE